MGIYGSSTIGNIDNNLSIGNIYTTSGLDMIGRVVGNNLDKIGENYAYKEQLLNGYTMEEEKGATLLSKEEVLNLNLGESYNYDKKEEGILPKLYNTESTELLPNQEDILLDESRVEESVNLEVESIETTKPNTTEAEITIRIKNPKEVSITGIEIEDMEVTAVTRNVTQNGTTSITVKATPTRYYDSYKLTEIKYKIDVQEEQTKEVEVEIPVQFYKEIYTYEDWQSIEEGTYQNYRLMADIDFNGKPSIKNNITVNRLEAENNIYTLKNITLEFDTANIGLINNVKTSIKNIEFENVVLTNKANSGNYFGIIASATGQIDNLKFIDIKIEAPKINFVGMIGVISSGSIKNISIDTKLLKENYIIGKNYVGGLAGRNDVETFNVSIDKINVSGLQDYIGGLNGYSHNLLQPIQNNIDIDNSSISGKNYVRRNEWT